MTLTAPETPVRTLSPRLALVLLALPAMLIAIDISVLSVALPQMAADLRPSPTELLWMNDIYGFMVGGTMITMGAVGDRIGRRRLIVICSAAFAAASALAAFAVAPWMIIATRALMGIAGAAIMPASMALIGRIFPDPKRAVAAMGAYMSCFLTGMAAAPLVGGLMMAHWWWGSVFLLGVPIMVVTLIAAPRLLPEFKAPSVGPLDLVSAALSLASILLLVAALKLLVSDGWSWEPAAAAAAGLALGWVFVRRQRRSDDPLVDLALLRRPGVARTMWVLFLTALLMGGTSLFWAFYLQDALELSPLHAAMWLLPSTVAMMVASNLGPWLAKRIDPARVVAGSLAVMAAGFACYTMVSTGAAGLAAVICGSVLATAGIGAAFPFMMNEVISRAPQERAGSAASFVQTANEIGIATGLVVLGSVGTLVYRLRMDGGSWVDDFRAAETTGDTALLHQSQDAFIEGFRVVGIVGVAIMALVLLLQLARSRKAAEAA
ncbi:MFS transporter, DHA2 family, multidrug resistance protein [Glycomyces sambucus]|uniref:MFS transporter, DHA2 family, multidrug resistance protein n=1 Tax=Glycomyces sambucus TaxID=380244 RepID=A0A1G9FXA3_9ACTN|nr:MFS transporter [Glycomyces sambucus]SDK93009.1 MFS transporter, DHA2 family, multidrug resistance protein [Glycomyces sambucus]